MTKDDIRKLAHEAGLHLATDVHWMPIIGFDYAAKLIALAAEREREACAAMFDDRNIWDEEVGERIRARGNK